LQLGLVDRIGNLQDAINSAGRMAKLDGFGLREYPESENWLNSLLGRKKTEPAALMKEQLGEENYRVYKELLRIREMTRSIQARLPYEFMMQ
jgi:protease-4